MRIGMPRRSVVVALCALAAAGSASAADAPSRDVSIPGKLFEPARITVLLGTTVTWRNGDASNHTVTSEADTFDSGYLAPGGSFSYTFAKQGHYAYECLIHKFMKGTVDVFSLVLTGPENPVPVGRQVVVAGLAPAGTAAVTLSRVGGGEPPRTVRARPDGSFTVRFRATGPGTYRASAGQAASPLVQIGVVPRVSVAHTATTVAVATVPARVGARAVLQTYDRDHFTWRAVAHTRLDARSRARLPIPAARPLRIRVVVRGEAGWSDAASRVIALPGRS
jgi:plastocyanin